MILADQRFRPWIELRLGKLPPEAEFLGSIKDGQVVAVVAFFDYSVHDIRLSICMEKSGGSKRLLLEVFDYVFRQIGCSRCTAIIRPSNTKSIVLAERLGFKKEGVLRRYCGEEDAYLFGLLKEECRYEQRRQTPEGS